MNWARQKQLPELDDSTTELELIPKRRGGSGAVLSALFMFALAAGCGYYALMLAKEAQAARTTLKSREAELSTLRTKHTALVKSSAGLERERSERDALLEQANAKLLALNTELAATQTHLDELQEERGAIKEQLAEFRQMTAQFRRMIDSGRLEVTFRRGRMIVEMREQVLFPSGSADLTEDGKKALAEVAKVLRGMPNRRFQVAGHTDNVPVSTAQFKNNWELSSQRAVNVTAALIRGGLRPEQLVAAGYSEYDPVARNTKEAGRAKNRRIEIILEPRLRELPDLEKAIAKKSDKSEEKLAANDKPAAAKRGKK